MTEQCYLLFGTKIYNHTTKEIGLLICTWVNEYYDGGVDCLGFLPRSQSFALAALPQSAQSVRYPGFTRPEIRFATCVDKKGKRYYTPLENIKVIDDED